MDKKIDAETDNIRVQKSVAANGPSTVIIGFRISSMQEEPAAIELRDPLPAEHEIHVQSESNDEWTITEEVATYERVLGPDETAITGYKSTTTEDQALEMYTTAPSIDVTAASADDGRTDEPAAAEPDTFTRGTSDAVFTFHGPESEPPEQPTPAGKTDSEDSSSKPHAADPTGPEETADEFDAPGDEMGVADLVTDLAPSTDSESDQSQKRAPSEANAVKASSNAASRSTERSAEAVGEDVDIASPAEVQARIQRVDEAALSNQPDRSSPSLEARVQYLQSQFSDLVAYIDAMEEFIDEHGDGEHVLTALTTDMERVQERFGRLDDHQGALQTYVEAIDDRVDTLDTREEAIDEEVSALAESLDGMEAVHQAVKEDVEVLKAFQETLQNAI